MFSPLPACLPAQQELNIRTESITDIDDEIRSSHPPSSLKCALSVEELGRRLPRNQMHDGTIRVPTGVVQKNHCSVFRHFVLKN